jgi:predicted acetyltransferase
LPEALEFRYADPREIETVARLVSHSFPGIPRTVEMWTEQLADPVYGGGAETLVVGLDGDRIVASLQIHRLTQWIAGRSCPIAGVGTVAVSPTYRKRRVGGALVQAAHVMARERGDVGAALYPFRVSFYQKLGYGNAGEAVQHLLTPDSLPDSAQREHVEIADSETTRAEVLSFYNRWVEGQTGQMARTERVFTSVVSVKDRALFAYRGAGGAGGVEGYAIVTYRTDLPRRDRFLEVEEIVWGTPAARRGLLAWLSSMGDQWDQIMIRTLPSQRLVDVIREPRMPPGAAPLWLLWSPAATIMMGPMFRLIDIEKAWTRRRIKQDVSTPVLLDVRDDMSSNAGVWKLTLDGGATAIERVDDASAMAMKDAPLISLDVSTLSRLYIGSLTATAAHDADLLRCDRADVLTELDGALDLPDAWTFDRF